MRACVHANGGRCSLSLNCWISVVVKGGGGVGGEGGVAEIGRAHV